MEINFKALKGNLSLGEYKVCSCRTVFINLETGQE
jgi:hypothetical protein